MERLNLRLQAMDGLLILLKVRVKVFLKLLLFLEVLRVRTILFYVLQCLETLPNLIETKPFHLDFLGPVSFLAYEFKFIHSAHCFIGLS